MPNYFFDTSALAKHFHREVGSQVVDELLTRDNARHLISRLTCVELVSASAGKVREQRLTESDFTLFMGQFKAELNQKKYQVIRLLNRHFHLAQQLIKKHGLKHRLRALDAIQLAVALDILNTEELDLFVCADDALIKVAALEGLVAKNPTSE